MLVGVNYQWFLFYNLQSTKHHESDGSIVLKTSAKTNTHTSYMPTHQISYYRNGGKNII